MVEGRPPQPPAVWGNVPQRNKNFFGREEVLAELRSRMTGEATAALAYALHGLGGVGKTQLAVEYCHRHASEYDLVWWIPAQQLPAVRHSLAALAPRLGIDAVGEAAETEQEAVGSVLDALRRGVPSRRWLLVFDDADQPEDLGDLLPPGTGHVLVTSRNYRWQSRADAMEVGVFARRESLDFLATRAPGLDPDDAERLSTALGDLPLALEQAASLQAETGIAVDDYLALFADEPARVLAENPPAEYPVGVAAAWSDSATRLRRETPVAWELLRRMAFFGPKPIAQSLLREGRNACGSPLDEELADPILFGRATRELGRFALARVDNCDTTLQMHPLVQKFVRDGMDADEAHLVQHEVHLMLAAADPGDPDDTASWSRYAELLVHAIPSEAVSCPHPDVRRLVRNLARYLLVVGDFVTGDRMSGEALERWTADSGPDDTDVLVLAGQRANLLWARGEYRQADKLRRDTLRRMREVLGDDHEETLLVMCDHGADLRARGEFMTALRFDTNTLAVHTRLFGQEHPRTLMAASCLAVDRGLNGEYAAANETDNDIYEDRLSLIGRNDHPWVVHSLAAIARDLRDGGRYREALRVADEAYAAFLLLVQQRVLPLTHPWVLAQAKDLSVTRRRMGHLVQALELAEDTYQRYIRAFDRRHPDALAAAVNLGNACRVYGHVTGNDELITRADALIAATFTLYSEVYGPDHPFTHGCALNLASVRRRMGDEIGARRVLEDALDGLERRLGGTHHYTLICQTALASSLSATGDVMMARKHGRRALDGLRRVVGDDHPHTLACASNLVIDLRVLGEHQTGAQLAADTLRRYASVLPADHVDVLDATAGRRIPLDFEPPPL